MISRLRRLLIPKPLEESPQQPVTVVREQRVFAKPLHDTVTDIVDVLSGHVRPTDQTNMEGFVLRITGFDDVLLPGV